MARLPPYAVHDSTQITVHPKVASDILGHKKVNLAMDVYDRTDVGDFEKPLEAVSSRLLPNFTQSEVAA
jgi:hypothetical protein